MRGRWWRGVVAAVMAASLASGCFFPKRTSAPAHRAAIYGDIFWIGLGAFIVIDTAIEGSCGNDDCRMNEERIAYAGFSVAAAAGIGLLVNSAMSGEPERFDDAAWPPTRPDPGRIAVMRSWTPPLVEGTDEDLAHLDALARAAALFGRCSDVDTLTARIHQRDARYYAVAIAPDPLLALCR